MSDAPLSPEVSDQRARDRVATDLHSTLFVEAGAGSGKTSSLIKRVVALITSGTAELRAIAAVTFTEKAGAELRDRLRQELERRADTETDPDVVDRCRDALDQLDGAAIGTLHSFAHRLLSEHPVEGRLPPRVEVLDEVTSGVQFERRWMAFRDELLSDPAMERTLLLLQAADVKPAALVALARSFDRNWDLVAEQVPDSCPEPPPLADLLRPALSVLADLCAERDGCSDPTDRLCQALTRIAEHAERLRTIDDELDLLEAMGKGAIPPGPSFNLGALGVQKNWADRKPIIHSKVKDAGAALDGVRLELLTFCAHRIGSAIRRFTLNGAEQRRSSGRLEFHDLLVLARELLRDDAHGAVVRTALHDRYQRLLLDEFQDTDPIQIELAVRIAAADPASVEAGTAPWSEVAVSPGHLFVVGDPKQSIYRFRRAEIAMFIDARDRYGPEGGGVVELTTNFRTVAPIIDWINATFGDLMDRPPDLEVPEASQPAYVSLAPVRPTPPVGPPVAVLGREAHPKGVKADQLRVEESGDVVATVLRALAEGWSVADADADATWRPARLGDIAILVPARTSLPFLEDALESAGVAYRAESSSLVYATRAVRDLLMVLRAVDDPTDHLCVVSALRSPLFGCGDDDLYRFKVDRGGRWSYLSTQPPSVPPDDPVADGLAVMADFHRQRRWLAPSELLDRIARDRRAMELGFAEGRPRDVWRRLRFVIDQARAWHEATGGSVREYLGWVEQQTAEGARVAEAVLPETDDDAVRIMTIHAAKGLEFPITIVSGLSTASSGRRAPGEARFLPSGDVAYRFDGNVVTPEFDQSTPLDEQMAVDERIRLLYVATTRAKDHLVVSLHRGWRASSPKTMRLHTNAELLRAGMGDRLLDIPDAVERAAGMATALAAIAGPPVEAPLPYADWQAERHQALARSSRPTAVAATSLADEGRSPHPSSSAAGPVPGAIVDPGLKKRPRDLDLPPWLKGRYGTSIGRAVHGVLQVIDLAIAEGVDDAVAAQCQAEAVPQEADAVRRLVGHALRAPSVREAAGASHWREVYACIPIEDRLLEGYIDLLYRTAEGLVVVDYKTTAATDARELDRLVGEYRLQGASYALAIGTATDEVVARVVFVFLTPGGAVERDLSDLDSAMREVHALVIQGTEVVV